MKFLPRFLAAALLVAQLTFRAACAEPAFAQAPLSPTPDASLAHRHWPAQWITHPTASPFDYGVYLFRKTFTLAEKPARFVVHVSADNRYRLYANGSAVCFGPQRNDASFVRYDSVDLAPWLHAGPNTLAVEVVNYGEHRPFAIVSSGTALIVQGDTASERVADTDKSWLVSQDPAYSPLPPDLRPLYAFIVVGPGDAVDGARHPWGWNEPGFDDRAWSPAKALGHGAPYGLGTEIVRWLAPRNLPFPETLAERLAHVRRTTGVEVPDAFLAGRAPVRIPAHAEASVLLDNGVETNAFPRLTVSGGRGSSITLTYAEALYDAQGRKGNRNDVDGRRIIGFRDRFAPDGGRHRVFEPLDFRCYRYLQVDVKTGDEPLVLEDLDGLATGYPFHLNAGFSSDDPVLARIFQTGWHTARLCAFETYMDCPYYERLQYVGDTRIQALVSLYASGDDRLVRNAIDLFDRSRLSFGLTQSRVPSATPQVINTFSLLWVGMVHDYWMLRDDPAFVRARLRGVDGVLSWFEDRIDPATGLLGPLPYWTFVDWPAQWPWDPAIERGGEPPGAETGGSSIASLQYSIALDEAADLFGAFGQAERAGHCRKVAAGLRAAVLRLCWDDSRRLVADTPAKSSFSQHANALAVLSGSITGPQAADLMTRVVDDPSLVQCTLYFRFYLLRAMKAAGMGDRYVGELAPWRAMLDLGLTTFAERPEPTRSDCHAWSASPVYELLATVCGIEPASPGFKSVRIAPHLGPLKHAEGTVPHPAGPIHVVLEREGSGLRADIALPAGLSGEFVWKGSVHSLHPGTQSLRLP